MKKRRKLKEPPSYRRRRNPLPLYLAAFFVLLLVFTVLSLTVLFCLNAYEVSGSTVYTEAEIIEATGLRGNENLVRLSTSEIENRILARLPYIETVKVKKTLPSTLTITCTAAQPYATFTANGVTYTVTSEGRVLSETEQSALILLSGVKAPEKTLAENAKKNKRTYLTFESERTREAFCTLTECLETVSLGKITRISVPSYLELSFVLDERIRVNVGTLVDTDYKIRFLNRVFETADAVPETGYVIVDVSNTERGASVKTNVNNDIGEEDIFG